MCRTTLDDGGERASRHITLPGTYEKNHEELRRILPKGRSDFDALSAVDVAAVCSHVNSYPRPAREGRCPYDLAAPELPAGLLGNLGIVRVPTDDVTLRPALVAHAVEL